MYNFKPLDQDNLRCRKGRRARRFGLEAVTMSTGSSFLLPQAPNTSANLTSQTRLARPKFQTLLLSPGNFALFFRVMRISGGTIW